MKTHYVSYVNRAWLQCQVRRCGYRDAVRNLLPMRREPPAPPVVKVSKRLAVNPVMTPLVMTDPRKTGSASETPNLAPEGCCNTPRRRWAGTGVIALFGWSTASPSLNPARGEPTCGGPLLGFLRDGGNRSRAVGRVSERRRLVGMRWCTPYRRCLAAVAVHASMLGGPTWCRACQNLGPIRYVVDVQPAHPQTYGLHLQIG